MTDETPVARHFFKQYWLWERDSTQQLLLRRKDATVAPSARKKLERNSTAAATTVRSPTFNFVSTPCLYEFLQLISQKRVSSRLFVICIDTYFHKTWWSGAACIRGLAYGNSQETVQCGLKIGLHCLHTRSLLLQFGDFNKPTFSSHKFSFLFPTHDSLLFFPAFRCWRRIKGPRGSHQSRKKCKKSLPIKSINSVMGLWSNVFPTRLVDIYESSSDDLGRCFGNFQVTKAWAIPPIGYPPLCFRWYGDGYSAGVDGFSTGVASSREREVPGLC